MQRPHLALLVALATGPLVFFTAWIVRGKRVVFTVELPALRGAESSLRV